MGGTLPAWAGIVVAVAVGVLGLFLQRYDKRKANDLIIKTNPDDAAGVADFDERDRLQNDRAVSAEPKRDSARDD